MDSFLVLSADLLNLKASAQKWFIRTIIGQIYDDLVT